MRMRRSRSITLSLLTVLLSAVLPVAACTDFRLRADDGSVVVGRSMEWGSDLNSRLVVHPRGEECQSPAPEDKPGRAWKGKFAYVGVDANNLDVTVDGLNEKGLSFGLLWLPEYTKYQDIPSGESATAISVTELGAWALSNFQSVDEVKEALKTIRVWAPVVPSFGGIPTAHVALHDKSGKSVVVEFVDGQQKVYENATGVLTNAPTFDWHLINLHNYLSLHAENNLPVKFQGTKLAAPGRGSGFFGMPGDWSPPSRFIRTAAIVHFSTKPSDTSSSVNLAAHILNAVDIPKGAIRETIDGKEYSDYTQWAVIKDVSHQQIYYRSYENLALRVIDISASKADAITSRIFIPVATPGDEQAVPASK
jgi:choloylglycine hydrolase